MIARIIEEILFFFAGTMSSSLWVVFGIVFLVLSGCGKPHHAAAPVMVQECGTGLAAVDLSGQCRARPNATMGALEAQEDI